MKKYLIVSDVHYEMDRLISIIHNTPKDTKVIQLGDLLLGLPGGKKVPVLPYDRFGFISGNHEDRDVAKEHPNYLGDYGCIDNQLFFVSGAMSPDYRRRTENYNWFANEQLDHKTFWKVLKLYEKKKPKYVITHDGPNCLSKYMGYGNSSLTQHCFEMMTEIHKPSLWITGHFHKSANKTIKGIKFKVLPFLGTYELNLK